MAPACAAERPARSSFCGLPVISGIIIAVILIAAAVSTVIAVRRIIFAVIGRLVGRADDDHAFRVPVHRKAERIADVAQLVVVVIVYIIAGQLHGLVPHSDRRCRG